MRQTPIYADNAATTPVSPKALEAMLPYFTSVYGNPSAQYRYGYEAKSDAERARKSIGKLLGAHNNEIYFTSGGTESDNWALFAAGQRRQGKGRHIITAATEHSAIYKTALRMREDGYDVTFLPVDEHASVTPEQLEAAIREDTILVSLMMANNEIGTLLPIKELCAVAHAKKVLFHTDAVQAVGHVPVNAHELEVDMLSFSAHKFGGPKGMGGLYVRYGRTPPPLLTGGGQEKGGRSGTTNVAGIIGMEAALRESVESMAETNANVQALRDRLIEGLLAIPGTRLTGHPTQRLPGMASFVFAGFERPALVKSLDEVGVFASAGSACSAGSGDPSRVLLEAGFDKALASSPLRFSLSAANTMEEVEYIIDQMPGVLEKLRHDEMHLGRVFQM